MKLVSEGPADVSFTGVAFPDPDRKSSSGHKCWKPIRWCFSRSVTRIEIYMYI